MATRKPPLQRRRSTAQDAPTPAEDTTPVETPQEPEDRAQEADEDDVQDDMGHPAEPRVYLPVQKNSEPDDVYVLGPGEQVQESWFDVAKENSELVVPKKPIVRKVYPPNTVTPTYVQLAIQGVAMTKVAAVALASG